MSIIIALDQSTSYRASVAFVSTNTPVAGKMHNQYIHESTTPQKPLLELTNKLLAPIQEEGHTVSAVVATHGPGAFTSLRVCAAIAEALAISLKCPLVGIDTNQALAASYTGELYEGECVVHALLDARRQECYAASYRITSGVPQEIKKPHILSNDAIEEYVQNPPGAVIGNCCPDTNSPDTNSPDTTPSYPSALVLARLALAVGVTDKPSFTLNYIREGV